MPSTGISGNVPRFGVKLLVAGDPFEIVRLSSRDLGQPSPAVLAEIDQRLVVRRPYKFALGVERAIVDTLGPRRQLARRSGQTRACRQLAEQGFRSAARAAVSRFCRHGRQFAARKLLVSRAKVAGFKPMENRHRVQDHPALEAEFNASPPEFFDQQGRVKSLPHRTRPGRILQGARPVPWRRPRILERPTHRHQ